jgi:hypothetical protein
MASKLVIQQQKITTALQSAADTHAESAAVAVEKLLAPHLQKGEKMPDVALLLKLSGRLLEESTRKLVEADEAHERELADDRAPRERRDAASQAIYSRLVDLRDALSGLYGTSIAEAAGFRERTPKDPVQLARFASQVVGALGSLKLGSPRIAGAKLNPREALQEIEGQLVVLQGSLKEVAREVREAEQTLATKSQAMAEQQHLASGVANLLAGVFRLAGLDELAERVRPSARRAAEQSKPGDEETTDKPSA